VAPKIRARLVGFPLLKGLDSLLGSDEAPAPLFRYKFKSVAVKVVLYLRST
jgi:hypothetical protein